MKVHKRHSEQERIIHLQSQQQSGDTIISYCESHQISKQSFYSWRKKYARALRHDEPVQDFVSIEVEALQAKELNGVIAQIEHPNGCIISFYKDCPPSFLSRAIKQLT